MLTSLLVSVSGWLAAAQIVVPNPFEPPPPPPPQPPAPQTRMEVALQDDSVFLDRFYYDRNVAFQQVRQLAVSRLRVNVSWAKVLGRQARRRRAPRRPVFRWSRYDNLAAAAAARGIRLQLDLTGPAPAFATRNRRIGPKGPSARHFARFAAAAARHFRGRVDRYSIWNEPNWVGWLSPQRSAAGLYRSLYISGYGAIKAADPAAKVLVGETAPYYQPGRAIAPLTFLRRLTCVDGSYRPVRSCAPLLADGFAHHPYDFERAPEDARPGADNVTMGSISKLVDALDRLADSGALRTPGGEPMDLYLTEFGYFVKGSRALPSDEAAAYLQRAFERARQNPRVRQMLQFLLVSPSRASGKGFFDTSLITLSGHPRPAFITLAAWAKDTLERQQIVAPGS